MASVSGFVFNNCISKLNNNNKIKFHLVGRMGIYRTGHIKDPVPLIESRASCPSGRFHPSCIHQVIMITARNKYVCMTVLALKMASDADSA